MTSSTETHRLAVSRTARYVTLGDAFDPNEVWFLCHGYGQLASEFVASAKALAGQGKLLVVPEALSRFYLDDERKVGASWMTREDRLSEITDYLGYLDLLHDRIFEDIERSAVALGLLGFSQGVATAARWAVRGKVEIDEAVFWGSALPPELDLRALAKMRVTIVAGNRDPFFDEDVWAEERNRLSAAGVSFEELTFRGGHRLDDETLRKLGAAQRR